MSNLLDNIGKFRTMSDEEFAKLISKPSKYEIGCTLPDDAYTQNVNSKWTQRYLRTTMEDFIEKYMRKQLKGISREDIVELVRDTCSFFGQDDLCELYDVSDTSLTTQMRSSLDEQVAKDELYYNLDELIRMGVTTVDAFTLVLTHELAHRYFKNRKFFGLNKGAWEMELACDFFAGVRSQLKWIYTTGMRWSLGNTPGTDSHPPGFLRLDIMNFARSIVYKQSQKGITPSFKLYLEAYNYFMEKKAKLIWMEQHSKTQHGCR